MALCNSQLLDVISEVSVKLWKE